MVANLRFLPFLSFFFLISSSFIPQSSSQHTPQNIQVFYPFPLPPPPPPPPLPPPETSPTDTPTTTTPTPTTPTAIAAPTSKSSNKNVVTAVAATAASTLVLSALLFLFLVKYKRYRKEKEKEIPGGHGGNDTSNTQNSVVSLMNQFTKIEGIKGVIVDEEGLDVLYWKNLEDDEPQKSIFKKELPKITEKEEEKKIMTVDHGRKSKKLDIQIQEVPLLRGKSSASHIWPQEDEIKIQNSLPVANLKSQLSSRSPPPTPPPLPPPVMPPPPPPPPKTSGLTLPSTSSSTPPPGASSSQVKLKPLHWEKVNANVEHPTAWDKMGHGSFR
ncbi:hypothetical protein L1887_30493 [Cichorium endivia]|nr:hypothetical protein L1887_30493 [Cichorium endivia]